MYERSGSLVERKFREYLLPTILTTIAISMANVMSNIIVGNYLGEAALSAIGLSAPVVYGLNAVFLLFAVGGVTRAAIAKGRREMEDANRFFTLTFVAGLSVMFLLLAAVLLFAGPISRALAQGDAALTAVTQAYLVPIVFVGPAMMLILGMAQFVRADGKPRIAAYIALTANLVKVVLTYSFARFTSLGIMGAALGTVFGYTAGIVMLLPYLCSGQRTMRFVRPRRSDLAFVRCLAVTGSPKALVPGLSFTRTLVLNALIVSALGSPGMAAMMVCLNALMLAMIFINGANDTLLPIVGTLYGEKDYRGIRFTVHAGFKFMIVACAALTALFVIAPAEVARLFGITSPEGVAVAEHALRLYALSLPLYGLNTMLQSFYQTTGRVKVAALLVSLNGFGFVVLFALFFAAWNGHFIWLAFVLAETLTLLVALGIGVRVRKKEPVGGMLLVREEAEDSASIDLSIPATAEAAVSVSDQIMRFCRENGADEVGALRVGVAAEEMAVNIARYSHGAGLRLKQGQGSRPEAGRKEAERPKAEKNVIDVLVRVKEQELVLRVRDNGAPFDPTQYHAEEEQEFAIGGIEVVRRLATDINYTRQLGFNVSVATVPRVALRQSGADGAA